MEALCVLACLSTQAFMWRSWDKSISTWLGWGSSCLVPLAALAGAFPS
jgi:hypothetical protein